MTVKFFNQPYLLYLYSIDNYSVKESGHVVLKSNDQLTLVFCSTVTQAKRKITTPHMEYDVIV